MDKPTIGRCVWYWPHLLERNLPVEEGEAPQAFDAHIAHVNSDGTVNVSITNDLGYPITPRQNVILRDTPNQAVNGECSWMQYHVQKSVQSPSEPLPGA